MALRTQTDLIVFHCSATAPFQDVGRLQIEEWHLARGFSSIGYHFVIRRNGVIELGRDLREIGAHAEGHNSNSVAVCMVGGLDYGRAPLMYSSPDARPTDGYTPEQWESARKLVAVLRLIYPAAKVCGHRDLSPDENHDGKIQPREWLKSCPGFDAAQLFPV